MAEIRSPHLPMSLERLAGIASLGLMPGESDIAVADPKVTLRPDASGAVDDDSLTPEQFLAKRQREIQSRTWPAKQGLLTLSRIVFDVSRSHAFLSYSYSCGVLCGGAGSLLLARPSGNWIVARTCRTQIS